MPSADALLLRTQTDERLAALARRGSERAYVTLVERHRRLLYATALRLVPAADADDVVQQALLSAWTALRGGTEVHHVRAWLTQILRNAATRHLARRVEAEDVAGVALAAPADAYASFQTRATLRETLANVARLPEPQRVALLRTVAGGLSQQEVADQLGTSEGGVRQLVHRARRTLRAAATAITPWPLLARLADADPMTPAAAGAGAATVGMTAKVAVGLVAAGALSTAGVALHAAAQHRAPVAASADRLRRAAPAEASASAAPGLGEGRPLNDLAAAAPTHHRPHAAARARHGTQAAGPVAGRRTVHVLPVAERAPTRAPAGAAPVTRRPTGETHDGTAEDRPTRTTASHDGGGEAEVVTTTPTTPSPTDDGAPETQTTGETTTEPSDGPTTTTDDGGTGSDAGGTATDRTAATGE